MPTAWSHYSPPIRALLDEYARAIRELDALTRPIPDTRFQSPSKLSDKNFADMRDIFQHIIGAAHVYADYIEDAIDGQDRGRRTRDYKFGTAAESMDSVGTAFGAMVAVLDRIKDLDEEAMDKIVVKTRWHVDYTLDQMLEHAIVHILRHRRQVERWLNEG